MARGREWVEAAARFALKYKYLLVVIVVGVLMLMLPTGGKKAAEGGAPEFERAEFSLEQYEARIERALEHAHGVGRVMVVLTLKSGMESVYAEEARQTTREHSGGAATERQRDSDRRPSIVSDGSGGEVPVLIKQVYPEFWGATIVCDGAENPKVRLYITEAVSSLTGIASDRISVIKMKD